MTFSGVVVPKGVPLHDKCALHRAQSTTHPFSGGGVVTFVLRLASRGRKDAVVGVAEGPDRGIRSGSGGNSTKLVADDDMSEVVHVEIVPIIAEGVLDFLAGNQETEEDEGNQGCTRNRDPAHGFPDLEGKGQTIDCGDGPQMDGVRERNGCSQNPLEASQRVSEGEQGVQQSSGRCWVDRLPRLESRDVRAQV